MKCLKKCMSRREKEIKNKYSRLKNMITDEELNKIEIRVNQTQNGPWKAFIEGVNHQSGSSCIVTGESDKGIDLVGATDADIVFIANAKQDIPLLIKEIRELKKQLQK